VLETGSLSWSELPRRTWGEVVDDDVLGPAAQLSYYFFLAPFPAILFLLALPAASSLRGSSVWPEAEQTEGEEAERNDRLLSVAANSAAHRSIRQLNDLGRDLVAQIEHFFVSDNQMKGKRFEVNGRAGSKRARILSRRR
jgi:inorganic pyrophosphatase